MKTRLVKLFLLFWLILGQSNLFGQEEPLKFYYPDGSKYKGKAKNIGQINKELEPQGRVYFFCPYADDKDFDTTVGYIFLPTNHFG